MDTTFGNMKRGMICLNCGYLTDAIDMFWKPVFEFIEDDVPILWLECPRCHHIKSSEIVTYMISDSK